MNALPLIEAKRDGHVLSADSIQEAVRAYTDGHIPDYQMAALLMAIYFRGLTDAETRALTFAMRDTGEKLSFPANPSRPVVDKHSTGGVGDKVSLPLAPLLACLGFRVPMVSGRSLGITGGTLDKLESIPGFRTKLSPAEMLRQVEEVGCVICGQTETMCPADRAFYALRDVTGTVPSIPLIAASILSKKLCEGIEALVLDVKFGWAAFMQTRAQAQMLATVMARIAREAGIQMRALITTMDSPIGQAAGNWLEVKEAVECLDGRGPADLRELVVESAASLLLLTGKSKDPESARAQASETLLSGAPRRKWDEMLRAQGADPAALVASFKHDHLAPSVIELRAPQPGFITRADARTIGEVVRDLGGGRMTKDATVDPTVGVDKILPIGTQVTSGASLCRIHARSRQAVEEALRRLERAFEISELPPAPAPRIVEVL